MIDRTFTPGRSIMPEEEAFRDLIGRVRAGDAQAAAELVRQYEPEIRRAVRVLLAGSHLRRLLDSMDISQSVLANFFVRVAAGQFEVDDPAHLLNLLVTMAHNRLRDQARKQHTGRRDARRQQPSAAALEGVASPDPGPAHVVAGQDLLQQLRSRLSDEERHVFDQWANGCDWAALAAQQGCTPDALRMRHARAIDRAARQLGLEEV
jgi:RNA polymerase sigma-70 factor (ECF subfamily)